MSSSNPPDDTRLKQLREENEQRRRKREQTEKALRNAEELKAKEALERRRLERLADDQRMRQPWQQPEAPKKSILRAGQKKPKAVSPPPPIQDVSQASDQRKQEAQRARREWQEGLRAHICGQRGLSAMPSQPSTPTAAAAVADAAPAQPTGLTWDEIKLAANEGFENLVKKIEMEQFMAGDEPRRQQRAAYKTKNKPTAGPEHTPIKLLPTLGPPTLPSPDNMPDDQQHDQQQAEQVRLQVDEPQAPQPTLQPAFDSQRPQDQQSPMPGYQEGDLPQQSTSPQPAVVLNHLAEDHGLPVRQQQGNGSRSIEGDVGMSQGRRGVTTVARHRPLPVGAEQLDLAGAVALDPAVDTALVAESTALAPAFQLCRIQSVTTQVVHGFPDPHSSVRVSCNHEMTQLGSPDIGTSCSPYRILENNPAINMVCQDGYDTSGGHPDSVQQAQASPLTNAKLNPTRMSINQTATPTIMQMSSPANRLTVLINDDHSVAGSTQSPRSPIINSAGSNAIVRRKATLVTTMASPSSPAARRAAALPEQASPGPTTPVALTTPHMPYSLADDEQLNVGARPKQASPGMPAGLTATVETITNRDQDHFQTHMLPDTVPSNLRQSWQQTGTSSHPSQLQQDLRASNEASQATISGSMVTGLSTLPHEASPQLIQPLAHPSQVASGTNRLDESMARSSTIASMQPPQPPTDTMVVEEEGEDEFGAVLAEVRHLAMLRKALRAEFEAMGQQRIAAALTSLESTLDKPAPPAVQTTNNLQTTAEQHNVSTPHGEIGDVSTSHGTNHLPTPHPMPKLPQTDMSCLAAESREDARYPAGKPSAVTVAAHMSTPSQLQQGPGALPQPLPVQQPVMIEAVQPVTESCKDRGAETQEGSSKKPAPAPLLQWSFPNPSNRQVQAPAQVANHNANQSKGPPVPPMAVKVQHQSINNDSNACTQPVQPATGQQEVAVLASSPRPVARNSLNAATGLLHVQRHDNPLFGVDGSVSLGSPQHPPQLSLLAAPQMLQHSKANIPSHITAAPVSGPTGSHQHVPGATIGATIQGGLDGGMLTHDTSEPLIKPQAFVQPLIPAGQVEQPRPQHFMQGHVGAMPSNTTDCGAPYNSTFNTVAPDVTFAPATQGQSMGLSPNSSNHNNQRMQPPSAQPQTSLPLQLGLQVQCKANADTIQQKQHQAPNVQYLVTSQEQTAAVHAFEMPQPMLTLPPPTVSMQHASTVIPTELMQQPSSRLDFYPGTLQLGSALQYNCADTCQQPPAPSQHLTGPANAVVTPQQGLGMPQAQPPTGIRMPQQPVPDCNQASRMAYQQPQQVAAQAIGNSHPASRPEPLQWTIPAGTPDVAVDSHNKPSGYATKLQPVPNKPSNKAGKVPGSTVAAAATVSSTEKPQVLEGSYLQAAAEARARAAADLQHRQALAVQLAAQRAAAAASQQAPMEATLNTAVNTINPKASELANKQAVRAPVTIGSYSRPGPPPQSQLATTKRPAATQPSSTPISYASTPSTIPAGALPHSAPITPNQPKQLHPPTIVIKSGAQQAGGVSRIPSNPPSRTHSGGNRTQAQPRPNDNAQTSELDAVLAGMQDVDGAIQELDDFLERASFDDSPERAAADKQKTFSINQKLQEQRPLQLQLPASGRSTPAVPAATSTTNTSKPSTRNTTPTRIPTQNTQTQPTAGTSKQQSRAVSPSPARPSSVTSTPKACTPFVAAVQDLFGLPGVAPLQAAQQQGLQKRASKPDGNTADRQTGRHHLCNEEAALLASLQRIDRSILDRVMGQLVNGGNASPATAQPPTDKQQQTTQLTQKQRKVKASGRAAKGVGSSPIREQQPSYSRADGCIPSRSKTAEELLASQQALLLKESLDRLDVRLARLNAKITGRAAVAISQASSFTNAGNKAGNITSSPARPGNRAAIPTAGMAAKNQTPTPNKAKALRDAKRAQLLAAGQRVPGESTANHQTESVLVPSLPSMFGRQASAGARMNPNADQSHPVIHQQAGPRQASAPAQSSGRFMHAQQEHARQWGVPQQQPVGVPEAVKADVKVAWSQQPSQPAQALQHTPAQGHNRQFASNQQHGMLQPAPQPLQQPQQQNLDLSFSFSPARPAMYAQGQSMQNVPVLPPGRFPESMVTNPPQTESHRQDHVQYHSSQPVEHVTLYPPQLATQPETSPHAWGDVRSIQHTNSFQPLQQPPGTFLQQRLQPTWEMQAGSNQQGQPVSLYSFHAPQQSQGPQHQQPRWPGNMQVSTQQQQVQHHLHGSTPTAPYLQASNQQEYQTAYMQHNVQQHHMLPNNPPHHQPYDQANPTSQTQPFAASPAHHSMMQHLQGQHFPAQQASPISMQGHLPYKEGLLNGHLNNMPPGQPNGLVRMPGQLLDPSMVQVDSNIKAVQQPRPQVMNGKDLMSSASDGTSIDGGGLIKAFNLGVLLN